MLLTIDHVTVDTDYPEDSAEQIVSLLPEALRYDVKFALEQYKYLSEQVEELEGERDGSEEEARALSHKITDAMNLLDTLINSTKDVEIVSDLMKIRKVLY